MKLRKIAKTAPVDLDDPLATDSDDDYESNDGGAYLTDVTEEDLECDQEDEGEDVEADLEDRKHDDDALATSDGGNDLDEDVSREEGQGADGAPSSSGCESDGGATPLGVPYEESTGEARVGLLTPYERDTQQYEGDTEDDTEDMEARLAFNPFALLTDNPTSSDSGPEGVRDGERLATHPAAVTTSSALALDSDDKRRVGMDVSGGGGAEQRRRRKQRRNPRRRRRRRSPSGASGNGGGENNAVAADSASTAGLALAVPAPGPGAPCGCSGSADCRVAACHLRASSGSESGAQGSEADDELEEGEEGFAECWLCYGEGRVVHHISPGRSRSCGTCAGAAGGEADAAMVAPCRTCSGGLRYIHRSCLQRWLDSSWALACPNCRTLYDSAVLDAVSDGPSVRSMLLAACPPSHDLRQPFPPGAVVYFVVGSTVQLCMACGDITAVELLRRIRLYVEDMSAMGGDGGLSLVDRDGRPGQLPGFEVTHVALEFDGGVAHAPWDISPRARLPLRPEMGDDDYDDYDDYVAVEEFALPAAEWPGPFPAGQRGLTSSTQANAAVTHRDGSTRGSGGPAPTDAYDGFADWLHDSESSDGEGPLSVGRPGAWARGSRSETRLLRGPPADLRQRSFSARYGNRMIEDARDSLLGLTSGAVLRLPLNSNLDWPLAQPHAGSSNGGTNRVDDRSLLHVLRPPRMPRNERPPIPARVLWRDDGPRRDAGGVGSWSAVDRAVQRAEHQRRRADLQLQQRGQISHGGGSRGQPAMPGGPRGGGDRRRR